MVFMFSQVWRSWEDGRVKKMALNWRWRPSSRRWWLVLRVTSVNGLRGRLLLRRKRDHLPVVAHLWGQMLAEKAWPAVSALIHPKGVLSGCGQDSVQASQVLPHKTCSSMSLWTLLCMCIYIYICVLFIVCEYVYLEKNLYRKRNVKMKVSLFLIDLYLWTFAHLKVAW